METKKREKLLMITTAAVLMLVLLNYAVINPLIDLWSEKSTRIRDLGKQLETGQKLISMGTNIHRQWNRMQTNCLPSNPSQAEAAMLKAFERWERTAGITRQSLRPQFKTTEDNYATLECNADYTADMDHLFRFLYEVEHDPLGVKIENIQLASRDDTGSQVSLQLQVSGLVMNPEKSGDQQ